MAQAAATELWLVLSCLQDWTDKDWCHVATLFGGIIGGIGGLISYDDQLRGLGHSWTTERRKFFKKNPSISKSMVLHHPYGRRGANIRFYYPVTVEEHRMIHQKLGYGKEMVVFTNIENG